MISWWIITDLFFFIQPTFFTTQYTKKYSASKLCETLNCEFKCRSSLEGGVCYCNAGMTINPVDKRTCIDLNECSEWGYCDQLCTNTEGSYKCSCSEGYTLVPPRHCKANNGKFPHVLHPYFSSFHYSSSSYSGHLTIRSFSSLCPIICGVKGALRCFLASLSSFLCLLHHLSFILFCSLVDFYHSSSLPLHSHFIPSSINSVLFLFHSFLWSIFSYFARRDSLVLCNFPSFISSFSFSNDDR